MWMWRQAEPDSSQQGSVSLSLPRSRCGGASKKTPRIVEHIPTQQQFEQQGTYQQLFPHLVVSRHTAPAIPQFPPPETPVWVSHATRTPFTDLPHAMAIDNPAPSKRSRNPLTTNETVCESRKAPPPHAHSKQTLPFDMDMDDKHLPHKTGDPNFEPFTLRRLMFCVVQRCLRVLSCARHQQPREGTGSDPPCHLQKRRSAQAV